MHRELGVVAVRLDELDAPAAAADPVAAPAQSE